MARRLEEGLDCAFPLTDARARGTSPTGTVMRCAENGMPDHVFTLGWNAGRRFEKTWDHFLMPKRSPGTLMRYSLRQSMCRKMPSAELMETKHAEMQREWNASPISRSWFSLSV